MNNLLGGLADKIEQKLPRFVLLSGALSASVIFVFLIIYFVFGFEPERGTNLFNMVRSLAFVFLSSVALAIVHNIVFLVRRMIRGQSLSSSVAEYEAKYGSLSQWLGGAGGSI